MSTVIPFARRSAEPAQTDRAVYTVPEVAELLALGLGTTYQYLREGLIPAKRVGKRWVISRRQLHAWLDSADAADVSATGGWS